MSDAGAEERAKRESVFRTAVINIVENGRRVECRVRNVSPTGVGVSHRGELRAGMAIGIAVGKTSPVDARVAWATDAQAGIAFGTAPTSNEPQFGDVVPVSHAGWLAEIDDPYRK